MLIQDRVKLIMKANSLTASQFADQIGIKRSNLSHVLSGRNKPSLDFLSKIISHFPNVNASWLITGETRNGEFQEEKRIEMQEERNTQSVSQGEIEKIVHYYKDGTFKEYSPLNQ